MKQVIEKAREGGWDGSDEYGGEYTMDDYLESIEKIVLDPKFWEALGKVEGWDESDEDAQPGWKEKMNGLTPHIIEGGDIDSYFNRLFPSI